MLSVNNDYKTLLTELKNKVRTSQLKAAVAVNSALIEFYWELGKMISEKEKIWGNKLIEKIAFDLKLEFPDLKGLSRRNLFNCKQLYNFYNNELVQQPVALIPWSHNILIFTEVLPDNLKSSLPTIEEIENDLNKL